jgi:hypothetical protein
VLGDGPRLACGNAGAPDVVKHGRLAVVDVAEDRNDGLPHVHVSMDKGCAILFFTHWANTVTSALPYPRRRMYLLPRACMNAKKKFENQHFLITAPSTAVTFLCCLAVFAAPRPLFEQGL